jgi:predicted alpha/beta-fold hydrolase
VQDKLLQFLKRHWRHIVAVGLFLGGFALTIWLGVSGASTRPLTGERAALLVVLAGFFQLGGASLLHKVGKAEPSLARTAVRALLRQARRAQQAEQVAQSAFETGSAAERTQALGAVSVHLSYLAEGAVESIAHWQEFHSQALEAVLKEEDLD